MSLLLLPEYQSVALSCHLSPINFLIKKACHHERSNASKINKIAKKTLFVLAIQPTLFLNGITHFTQSVLSISIFAFQTFAGFIRTKVTSEKIMYSRYNACTAIKHLGKGIESFTLAVVPVSLVIGLFGSKKTASFFYRIGLISQVPLEKRLSDSIKEYTHSTYIVLNGALRGHSLHYDETCIRNNISTLTQALDAIPSRPHTFWRGVFLSQSAYDSMVVDNRYIDKAFLSCSRRKKKAMEFAFTGSGERCVRVLFRIKKGQAPSIAPNSLFPSEKEHLYKPGATFTIQKIQELVESKTGISYFQIDLKESV